NHWRNVIVMPGLIPSANRADAFQRVVSGNGSGHVLDHIQQRSHCGALLLGKNRGRPQRFCSDAHRQAYRKITSRPENGLRYRKGRVTQKPASKDSDLTREFEPENLSPKINLHFERVNEVTFKLTDGELTNVPASHHHPSTRQRRMLSQWGVVA